MILAGDVGGTKTVLGLFEDSGSSLALVCEQRYENTDFDNFADVVDSFLTLAGRPSIDAGAFGVAGAVIDGSVQMLNLSWRVEAAALERRFAIRRVRLLNDLEAAAYGMLHLAPAELRELSPESTPRRRGNVGMLAAGTGLGEAFLCWDGSQYHPLASEGGHSTFAPTNDVEMELLGYLRRSLGAHVSYERILSGPGLVNLHSFLRDTGKEEEPPRLTERLATGDQGATISACGLAGDFAICVRALDLFVSIYGAEAGNVALKGLTLGGIYVGGGIAPKILPKLTDGTFMSSFLAKGRRGELLGQIPVKVALNTKAPQIGAAHFARRL